MDKPPKSYNLDDDLKRGHVEKPILKEEQKRILERLLEIDRSSLNNDEQELMKKLVDQLGADTQRIKEVRRRLEGRGVLSELLETLQKDAKEFRTPSSEDSSGASPATPPPQKPLPQEPSKPPQRPASPRRPTAAAESSSVERVLRTPPKATLSSKPRPWGKVVKRDQETPAPPTEPEPESAPQEREIAAVQPESIAPPEPSRRQELEFPEMESSDLAPTEEEIEALAAQSSLDQEEPVSLEKTEAEQRENTPVAVVRRYIQAWNRKAFATEFECFSSTLVKMSKEDYVNRRMATFLTYNRRGDFSQEMGTVLRTHNDKNRAEVLCSRIVREFHRQNRYIDLYVLKSEKGKWRITGVTSEIARKDANHLSGWNPPSKVETATEHQTG